MSNPMFAMGERIIQVTDDPSGVTLYQLFPTTSNDVAPYANLYDSVFVMPDKLKEKIIMLSMTEAPHEIVETGFRLSDNVYWIYL